ncbi:WD40 repeat domain-containing protein [Anatilimnocola floriformis]|uniref:WD40 repeat domain-containing protein n=1 Tax=Anatilimnocola floriformis TaxID=2948575 RepID=UPI0020C536AA|nr:c-type cytochrome domain-containing protein [Anatilimnocola floriformis]
MFPNYQAPAYRVALLFVAGSAIPNFAQSPDYTKQIQPILNKYCTSCHNNEDREGKLSLESYDALLKGGPKGALVTAGHGDLSRMILVLTGKAQPAMPPKDSDPPTAAEIALLKAWIDAGAKGPSGAAPDPTILNTPQIKVTTPARKSVNAVAVSSRGNAVALARYGEVELQRGNQSQLLSGHRGSVNAISFSDDGQWLVAGAGEPGLFGEARIWNVADGTLLKTVQGHKDSIYAVRLSPDRKVLAMGGYDGLITLWDTNDGKLLKKLEGHNGAVFELAFRRDGQILASCSGDRTVKLWNVASGERLETLKEATKELYTLAFSPTGDRVAAAGVDNRIRIWQVSGDGKEGTNPLLTSKFAHETAVLRIVWSADGKTIVSAGEDRLIKVWNAADLSIRQTLPKQSDWATGLANMASNTKLFVGRIDGSSQSLDIAPPPAITTAELIPAAETPPEVDYGEQPAIDKLPKVAEVEPNDTPAEAAAFKLPGIVTGTIHRADRNDDVDLFRFFAEEGEQWIFETNAARSGSLLDSKLEILDTDGKPVPRVLLRGVRDTEIEFRGMNSDQRGVRLKNYEEMLLNEYVFLGGEVIKHFQQRRGPDADGNFFPENGNRFTFFETTPRAHALGEPGYMVVPYPVGTQLPNNGLPVFTLNFENDDQSQKKFGKDSQVTFVAPQTGDYLVRVSDVRNFAGDKYTYQLIGRRPQPGFKVTVNGMNPTVNAASGKTFGVKAERIDNFMGEIRVDISELPPGFTATSPLVIPAGLYEAQGVINCAESAAAPTAENEKLSKVVATAIVAGKERTQESGSLGTIKRADKPKVIAHLELSTPDPVANPNSPPEITLAPGGSVTAKLRIERQNFNDRVAFDVQNLPHGVIVDDIGLSGVLIVEGQLERTIFLRAEPWVKDQDRLFHAQANVEGNQVSKPMLLKIRK